MPRASAGSASGMLRDSAFSLLATTVRLLGSVVLFVVMAHVWGPDAFGAFMYPYTVAAVLVKVVDYGFLVQVTRDVAREPANGDRIVARALSAKLLLLGPVALCAAILAREAGSAASATLLWLLVIDAVAGSFALFLAAPLRATGQFQRDANVAMASNLLVLASTGGVVLMGATPLIAASAMLMARLAATALAWWQCRHAIARLPVPEISLRPALTTVAAGLPFGVHALAGTLNLHLDTLMVQHFLGAGSVGIYQAGMRLLLGLLLVADALNGVYLTALARALHAPTEVDRLATRMTRHLLTVGLAAFIGLAATAPWIGERLFGPGYDELTELLPLFGVLAVVRYWGVSYGTLLTLADRQGWRTVAVCVTLGFGVTLNVFLVPRFGLSGAVLASILGHLALYGAYAAMAWHTYRSWLVDARGVALAVAAIVLSFVSLVSDPPSHIVARTTIGGLLLGTVVVLGVSRAEWGAIRRRLHTV